MNKNKLQKFQNFNINNDRDPVIFLNEIFGKINCVSKLIPGVHNKCCFKVTMKVDGKCFTATGTKFKMAKRSCALAVLKELCNIVYDDNKIQPFVYVPKHDSKNLKLVDNINENRKQERTRDLKLKNFKQKYVPLTIEEIPDDDEQKTKEDKNSKSLQNITNFRQSGSSKINIEENKSCVALKETRKEFLENSNNMTDLRFMLSRKTKFVNRNLKKTLTNRKFSTMDVVNVQSVEMNLCIKSFARNPIENNDLNLQLIEEVVNKTEDKHQNHVSKRKRPRSDSPNFTEKPPAKRKVRNENNATISHLNWSQPKGNPLKVLNNLYPNLKFNFEAEMGSVLVPYFMMSAVINGRKFFGHGKSKQLAKKDAAIQILKYLEKQPNKINIKENVSPAPEKYWIGPQNTNYNTINSSLQLDPHLADIMQSKVIETFKKLTQGREEIREYKVLAGIVMTTNMNFEEAVLVSLATGTKCINGGNICCNGSVLNDSHAEIIAKRGLMKFLYTQLRWHCSTEMAEKSIFQRNPNSLQIPYSLKENVHFHLYINTAPCGDARIFSFNHHNNFNNNFNSGQYGQLRTKVEGGLGTTPVGDRYYPQTWDGVVLGEPLLTMSCSDKIALWNVVGIQGALLSQLIEPIYLHSIVLGSMFNDQHLYRAVCGRIQHTLGYLPQPYHLNRPLLGQTRYRLPRNTSRVPSLGINWTIGDEDIEIISLPTGRRIYNETSFLAKQAFFYKYHALLYNLPNIGCAFKSNNYAEAKENASDFQMAKREAIAAFYRAELGCWVKKPIEQNEFYMN